MFCVSAANSAGKLAWLPSLLSEVSRRKSSHYLSTWAQYALPRLVHHCSYLAYSDSSEFLICVGRLNIKQTWLLALHLEGTLSFFPILKGVPSLYYSCFVWPHPSHSPCSLKGPLGYSILLPSHVFMQCLRADEFCSTLHAAEDCSSPPPQGRYITLLFTNFC